MMKLIALLIISFATVAQAEEPVNNEPNNFELQVSTVANSGFADCPNPFPAPAQCRELRFGAQCWWTDSAGNQHTCRIWPE
jgi:hypothetical protein